MLHLNAPFPVPFSDHAKATLYTSSKSAPIMCVYFTWGEKRKIQASNLIEGNYELKKVYLHIGSSRSVFT